MSTNTLFFSLSALFVFFFFSLPIIFDWKDDYSQNYKSLPIYAATGSIEFKISVYCSIAVSLPMLLELVLRLLSNPSTIFVYKSVISNVVLLLSLLIPDIMLLSYVIPHLDLVALNVVINGRIVLLLWTTTTFLSIYGGPIFKLRITKCWYIILLAQRLVDFYGIYSSNCSPALAAPLGVLGITVFYYQAFLWFREFNRLVKLHKQTTDYCLSNIYVISICITMLGILSVFISKKFQYWIYFSSADLASFTYVDTIFYVLMFALQGNALQREATVNQNMLSVKRIFFRYMSHEIRTPLNTVMMGLQFLEEDMTKRGDSPIRRQTIGEIKESCDIAIKTLNDMLIYDKIETGGLILEKGTVDIVNLLETTTRPFQLQALQSNIILRIDKAIAEAEVTGPLLISADANKMSQVIRNITSNALKFTAGGGSVIITVSIVQQQQQQQVQQEPPMHVTLSPSPSSLLHPPIPINPIKSPKSRVAAVLTGAFSTSVVSRGRGVGGVLIQKYIKIDIRDTGHGISEENQGKLFQGIIQFSPGKLQNGGGSGLGLYISKGIVDSHGGSLSVHSQGEGFGSTFTVILPLLNVSPAAPPIAATSLRSFERYHPQPNTAAGLLSASSSLSISSTPLPTTNQTTSYRRLHSSLAYLQRTTQKFPLLSTRITSRRHTDMAVLPEKPGPGVENVCFDKIKRLRSHSEEKFSGSCLENCHPKYQPPLCQPGDALIGRKYPTLINLCKNPNITTTSSNGHYGMSDGVPRKHRWSDCSLKSICSDDVTENEHTIISENEKYLQKNKPKDSYRQACHHSNNAEERLVSCESSSKQTLVASPPRQCQYRLLVVDDVVINDDPSAR